MISLLSNLFNLRPLQEIIQIFKLLDFVLKICLELLIVGTVWWSCYLYYVNGKSHHKCTLCLKKRDPDVIDCNSEKD